MTTTDTRRAVIELGLTGYCQTRTVYWKSWQDAAEQAFERGSEPAPSVTVARDKAELIRLVCLDEGDLPSELADLPDDVAVAEWCGVGGCRYGLADDAPTYKQLVLERYGLEYRVDFSGLVDLDSDDAPLEAHRAYRLGWHELEAGQ